MSKLSNIIVAHNAASQLEDHAVVLNFIKANPTPEGEKAAGSYKRGIFMGSIIVFLAIIVSFGLLFIANHIIDKHDVIPPETAVERTGVLWDNGKITYTYDKKAYDLSLDNYDIGIELPDEAGFFPNRVTNVRIFLDKNGNLVDVYPERPSYGWAYLMIAIFDILLIIFCFVFIRRVLAKDWLDYMKWYSYEIAPLVDNDAMEIVRTKQYYRPQMPKLNEVTDKELVRKYKTVRRKLVLSTVGFVTTLVLFSVFSIGSPLAKTLGFVDSTLQLKRNAYFVIIAIVIIFLPIINHFEKKLDQLKHRLLLWSTTMKI